MDKLKQFLKDLFIGKGNYGNKKLRPAFQNQWTNFEKVWNDKKDQSFGIERVVRILLVLQPFLFPTLYIRHIGGNGRILTRKLVIELYVLLKFVFPFAILLLCISQNPFALFVVAYLMVETILYLSGLVFLSDIYIEPISYKRSLILLLINYVETTIGFAVLYRGLNLLKDASGCDITTSISAVYFSFVTSATVGFGEITAKNSEGQLLVVPQLIVMLLYLILFFSRTINSLDKKYNLKNKSNGNSQRQTTRRKDSGNTNTQNSAKSKP
jgi:hypothetical protein